MKKVSIILVWTFLLIFLMTISVGAMLIDYEEEFGEIDFEGETVTYVSWVDPFEEFEEGGEFAGRLEEAKEKFNIGEFEYLNVSWGDELQEVMMSRLLGGDSKYDIWMLPHNQVWPMITQGGFYPINEILPEEYYENLSPDIREVTELLSHKGEKYSIGIGSDYYSGIHLLFWNKEIFEQEGFTPLDELYESGDLTWDVIEEYAAKATSDTDGDGEIDQWGLGDSNLTLWAGSNDVFVTEKDENGKIKFAFDQKEAINALEKIVEWNNEDFFGGGWDNQETFDGLIAMDVFPIWQFGELHDEMDFEWGVVPLPKGPDAEDHVYFTFSIDSYYIPANAEHPEKMLALHNFLFRQDELLEDREELRTDYAPDETSYEVMVNAEEKWEGGTYLLEGLLGPDYEDDTPFGSVMTPIMNEGADPASEIDAGKDAIQSEIDEFFEQ